MPDFDGSDAQQRRDDDAREAAASRLRATALAVAREDRASLWDRFGVNIRTEEGIEFVKRTMQGFEALGIDIHTPEGREKAKLIWSWMARQQERSSQAGKRLLGWITAVSVIVGALTALIDIYLKVRGHGS